MSLIISTPPAEEPVTLAEAKAHLVIDSAFEDDDDLINGFITTARERVEEKTNRAIVTQTLQLRLDSFPEVIELPRSPIQSVTFVKYVDTDGVLQTLDPSVYTVDINSEPGRIYRAYNQVWPSVRIQRESITVEYVAGYGLPSATSEEPNIPRLIKQAINLLVDHWYENRELIAIGKTIAKIPLNISNILSSLRIRNIG